MSRFVFTQLAWLLLLLGQAAAANTIAFHVAADGNDSWSGRRAAPNAERTDGPFAHVERAQQAARQARKRSPAAAVTVLIRGAHRLRQPLVFTPEDSGSLAAPLIYRSVDGQKAVLSGGRSIGGWRPAAGGLWTTEIPEARSAKLYFRQLFVNGRRATRARSPNQGFFRVEAMVDPKPGAAWNEGVDRFRFAGRDIQPFGDMHNAEVVVLHSWNTSRVRIASVDANQRVVTFTGPTVFRPMAWDPQQRYYVENARELLDAPGEWYLDAATGQLSYWPLPGEDMTKADVVAPLLTELVRIEGDADSGRMVEHLHLCGLVLEHADWSLGPRGYGDPQAAVTVPAVVSAKGARCCAIEDCVIRHVGNYGLWFSRGCQQNRIVRNRLHDLGAGGIRLGEPAMPANDQTTSTANLVSSNYIHDGGHVYAGAVGFWLAHASDNVFSHNEIHSLNYSGISLGWNWSDVPTRTLRNTIEYNYVHHVVRGMLSDAGGIYTLGRQTGTAIRNNVFHDVFPYAGSPAMAWGIYMDQDSNGLLVENNVVYHTLTGGLMNTGSHGNVVRNNVFALSAWQAAWRWAYRKPPPSVVERNIFYLTQGELFHLDGGRDDIQSRWNRNLYWRTDGQPVEFYEQTFADWQAKGLDRHGLVADPRFRDPARHDFRLRPDSPALKLGIRSIDTSTVGLVGNPQWVNLPKTATFAATVLPSLAPAAEPVPIDDDFETTPVGQPPQRATVFEEGRGDSARIAESGARGSKRALRLLDASGLKHVFNPHLFYVPHFAKGTARLRVDLWLQPGAILGHEWRDSASPYRVGPSLLLSNGKLLAQGQPLADVPAAEWFHMEVQCPLGPDSSGKYRLTLTVPGREPQTFELPCVSSRLKRLEWLGFTSLATRPAEIRLDNLKLDLVQPPAGPALP